MDPARLRDILAVLRDFGVKHASVPLTSEIVTSEGAPALLEVDFEVSPEAATPFTDKDGKPVDLDEGAGPLTRDPDADLESANFPPQAKSSDG